MKLFLIFIVLISGFMKHENSIIGPNSSVKLLFSKITVLQPAKRGIVMHRAFNKFAGRV